jgi:hypothetical protein
LLAVILKEDPYSPAALRPVERMRSGLDRIDPRALVAPA